MATLQEILTQVQQLRQEVESLPWRINVSAAQVTIVNGLSDLSEKLGLIQAGEFRTGNRVSPGDGFSGVRIAYPPVSYGGNLYNLLGVDNDTVTVAFNSSDGTLITGDTEVTLSSDGIILLESAQSRFRFIDSNGLRSGVIGKTAATSMVMRSDTDLTFEVGVDIGTGGSTGAQLRVLVWDTGQSDGDTVAELDWKRDPGSPDMGQLVLNGGSVSGVSAGAKITIQGDSMVTLFADETSTGEIYYRFGLTQNTPTINDSGSVWMYLAGSRLVFASYDGTQAHYKYLDLQDASSDWVASTDAPAT